MGIKNNPRLFGVNNSNRDFRLKNAWGKNQFNSSFPASLCCYLHNKNVNANYLSIGNRGFYCSEINIDNVFGISPFDDDIFFAFEAPYTPFQKYIFGILPRTDLVIQRKNGDCITGIEIKLTALPDNTTCDMTDANYGSEIVVRPDTIVYLACSLARNLNHQLINLVNPIPKISNWSDAYSVLPYIEIIISSLKNIIANAANNQSPFLLQPIWKTDGKSPRLANKCLDVFVWSDAGFAHFISKISNNNQNATKITRQTRTAIWLYKMLIDIAQNGQFNHEYIIDDLSYNTKNDKAFAVAGNITNKFMMCDRLKSPVIHKSEIKNIILGGGQKLLSPERRFDAIIFNSPQLFDI